MVYRFALGSCAWILCHGLKVLESQNADVPGLPVCQGTALPHVVGDDHWQCDTLSGAKGAAAEKKCRESYDTDAKGHSHLQCAVSYRDSQEFNCLATTPCEAPKNPLEVWNGLKPLGDDVPMKRIHMKLDGTRLIHLGDYMMMAAMGPNKAVVCGALGSSSGTQKDYCQVVELKDGQLQTGERIFADEYAGVYMAKASTDKVVYCGKKGSWVQCYPLVADGMKLSKGQVFSIPKRKSEISMTFQATTLQLGENRVLLCFNERFDWSKHHALSCTVMEEKDGTWSVGPVNVLVEETDNAEAYMMAYTAFLTPEKVLMCYKGKQSEKFAKCGTVQVAGTTVSWAGDQLQIADSSLNAYRMVLVPLTSDRAMFCSMRSRCYLLGISGTTVSQISDVALPKSALEDRVGRLARLWSDRMVYCAQRNAHGPFGSPICFEIKCQEDVCQFGEPTTINGIDGKKEPLSGHDQIVELAPGKVLNCADDRGTDPHTTGIRDPPHPVCSLFYLEGQL